MRQPQFGTPTALLLALVIASGCGATGPPDADAAGRYKLTSIAASPIPRTTSGDVCSAGGLVCVRAGELWLLEDGAFTWWFYSDSKSSILDAQGYYTREGAWTIEGSAITLTTPGKADIAGAWVGTCNVSISPQATWTFGCP